MGVWFLATSGPLVAETTAPVLSHEVWDRSDGLAQSAVTALAAASPGYLFVGTQAGLSRFDGARFVNFPDAGSREERHFVTSLAQDGEIVWVGSRRGLLRYEDGVLTKVADGGPLASSYIRSLEVTPSGLLVGLSRGGLLVFTEEQVLPVKNATHGTFRTLVVDERGRLLAGSDDGLYVVNSEPTWTAESLLSGINVRAISVSGDTTCLGTDSGELRCQLDAGDFEKVHHIGAPITALLPGEGDELWIATNGDGVWIHRDGELVPTSNSLPIRFSFALHRDEANNIWVGSRRGLVRLQSARVLTFGEGEGLSHDFARSVLQADDRIWVGTGAGLSVADWPVTEEFRPVDLDPALAGIQVRALHQAVDGKLRIGTRSGVQIRMGSSFRSEAELEHLASFTINAFAEEAGGALWIATSGNGVWRHSEGVQPQQFLESTTVRVLLSDPQGVWIGSERGLWRYSGGALEAYEPLGQGIVLALEADSSSGGLWIGTADQGVLKIGADGRMAPRAARLEGPVFSIREIGEWLWFSTPTGITRVQKRELSSYVVQERSTFSKVSWDESSGMRSSESNGGSQPAAWVDDNNTLWVATIGGVVAIDTERAVPAVRPPTIWLEELGFDGVAVPFDSEQLLRLPAGKRNLDITYTGSQYSSASPITFRYRLLGFDDEWKEVGRQTRATFTNVPPGQYEFEVQGSTGGVWNERAAALKIELAPYLMERRSSWLVPGLVLLSALLVAWRLRERNARRTRRELEALVEERTTALATANRELAGLARTDSLTQMANRRWFDGRLQEEWARAARGAPLSLIIFDIDNFKSINDEHGHRAGDQCLKVVARLVSSEFRRAGDFVARFGGEEFVAILPGVDGDSVAERAETVRLAVTDMVYTHEGADFSVTVSCGVATRVPEPGGSPEILLEAADQALYRAKQAGKNCVRA